MILRNHGLLAMVPDLPTAFNPLWTMQRACEIQLASDAGAGAKRRIATDILESVPATGAGCGAAVNRRIGEAMLRRAESTGTSWKRAAHIVTLLLASMGCGSLAGALLLPRLRAATAVERTVRMFGCIRGGGDRGRGWLVGPAGSSGQTHGRREP